MKYDNQLRYASQIVKQYNGQVPLSSWLKEFFREKRQMGSRDRKTVSEMVFGFYRLGALKFNSVEERLLAYIGISDTLPELKNYFFAQSSPPLTFDTNNIFPFNTHLSPGIDAPSFAASFLTQPDLFLRIRPGKENIVFQKLDHNIAFKRCGANCIALENATKIGSILDVNAEVVIQDKSSQATGEFLKTAAKNLEIFNVWDCCAASGGKSILAYDLLQNIRLTVSDIRDSILHNLKKRFAEAGIKHYNAFVSDLTGQPHHTAATYDLIIADVPCSGSGTWARTPEQLYFFTANKISYYANLQKRIVANVVPALKRGGFLLYITCSVFREENEGMIHFLASEMPQLELLDTALIKGYQERADTLFAALFINR